MTKLDVLIKRLAKKIEWQKVPADITEEDIGGMIVEAIKYLYVVTGRGNSISDKDFKFDKKTGTATEFSYKLNTDEELFVMTYAERAFYKKVGTSLSDAIGYTTDALSITGADKGFKNISGIIDKLDNEIKILYYKMVRFTI